MTGPLKDKTMDDFISIQGVSKNYGKVRAVDSVDLAIGKGEFFSLLGPSGCGKTTLLRLLGGFEFPDAGRIVIDGADVTEIPPYRRATNTVFQSYAIFPHLNVADNIAFGLRNEDITAAERHARVAAIIKLVKLEGYEARASHALSGGERQRVALARALVKRPKVLLLDEPLGALDKRLREAMQIELRQLQRELKLTFIFVTHDQEEALSMSDRIAVMEKGHILQIAEPKALYEHPVNRGVAEFIGTMNVFDGRVVAVTPQGVTVDAKGLKWIEAPLSGDERIKYSPGDRVLIAIRPEKLKISRARPPGIVVRGTLLTTVYLGDRRQFQVTVEGLAAPISVAAQNAELEFTLPQNGEHVFLSWSQDSVIILPPE